jgi:hypothetical protein
MYGVWLVYGATCVNAWFWSTVFHTRDIAFTEMMDYFCAFSIVLFSLLAFLLRSIAGTLNNSSLLKFLISGAAGTLKYHVHNIWQKLTQITSYVLSPLSNGKSM